MRQLVTCPNCGAEFSNAEAKCPYCGTLNPSGAESAFMHELEGIRDDTDALDDAVQRDLKADFGHSAKRVVLIVVAVIVIVASLATVFKVVNDGEEQRALHDYQVREAFRDRYFTTFDELYEKGDDAALSEYVWSLTDDPGFDAVFYWNHVGYLEAYNDWEALKSFEAEVQQGSPRMDDYAWAASVAIRLGYPEAIPSHHSYTMSKEEETRAASYRKYARVLLQSMLQMSEDETLSFIERNVDEKDGLLDDELKRNLKQRLSELGTV